MATKILSQEQLCEHCGKWYSLSPLAIRDLERRWRQPNKIDISGVMCPRCYMENAALIPGRYDQPGTPKKKCVKQYTVLAATKPTVKVKTKKFIFKPYTLTHKGKRLTFQVRYNIDGTLPWQPVKIGTRWYMLRAAGVSEQAYRTEGACQRSIDSEVALYSKLMM